MRSWITLGLLLGVPTASMAAPDAKLGPVVDLRRFSDFASDFALSPNGKYAIVGVVDRLSAGMRPRENSENTCNIDPAGVPDESAFTRLWLWDIGSGERQALSLLGLRPHHDELDYLQKNQLHRCPIGATEVIVEDVGDWAWSADGNQLYLVNGKRSQISSQPAQTLASLPARVGRLSIVGTCQRTLPAGGGPLPAP